MALIVGAAAIFVIALFAMGQRRLALALGAAAIAAGVGIYLLELRQQKQETRRITMSDITIENVTFVPTFRGSYDLRGRVANKSQAYRIDGLHFDVTVQDCSGPAAAVCTVLGKVRVDAPVNVPPQQAGDFTGTMYFGSELRPKGKLVWTHELVSVSAAPY